MMSEIPRYRIAGPAELDPKGYWVTYYDHVIAIGCHDSPEWEKEANRWKEIVSESQETLTKTVRAHRIEMETLTKIIIDLARALGGERR